MLKLFLNSWTSAFLKVKWVYFLDPVRLELFHINDQQTTSNSVLDNIPGTTAVLNALRAQVAGADISILLGSGDTYIPGNFQEASRALYGARSLGEIEIQNQMGVDAIAVGNHEFDSPVESDGFAELIGGKDSDGESVGDIFGQAWGGASFPFLSTNLDFSNDAFLAPLVVEGGQAPQAGTLTSSVVIEKGGQKIGVVGATTPGLPFLTSSGGVVTTPSVQSQSLTDAQLLATAEIIQAEVNSLLAANSDVNKVILASHMQVFDYEVRLAELLKDVDIVIAGGSEPVAVDADDVLRAGDVKTVDYPVWKTNAGGTDTAVVTESGDYDYLGRLIIDFDDDGNILKDSYDSEQSGSFATDAAGVARVGGIGLEDPEVVQIVEDVRSRISSVLFKTFGYSNVFLNSQRGVSELTRSGLDGVRTQETNLGNITADANLAVAQAFDPDVLVSIKNGGGIRADIGDYETRGPSRSDSDADLGLSKNKGAVVQGDIQGTLAFNNGLRLMTLTVDELLAVLEHGVAALPEVDGRFPQVSGVQFHYDSSAESGSRITDLNIVDTDGSVLHQLMRAGELVEGAPSTMRIVTLDFLTNPRFDENGTHIGAGDSYPFPNFNRDASAGDIVSKKVAKRINVVELDEVGLKAGDATFATAGTEQDALAEYLLGNHATPDTAFSMRDVGRAYDTRIIDTAFQPAPVVRDNKVTGSAKGAETLKGSSDHDEITAFKGSDVLKGRKGNDYLHGGDGKDNVMGGSGDDVIDGGNGSDTLTGGRGQDRFVLSKGKDVVTDFNLRKDHVALPADANVNIRNVDDGVKIVGYGFKTTLDGVSHVDFIAQMPIAHI